MQLDIMKEEKENKMYVYIKSEPSLWTVGFYNPQGKWIAESDWGSTEEAAQRVCILNGGNLPYIIALEKIARADEVEFGYDHPEKEMIKIARSLIPDWRK
jgi:hypothetical protein